MTLPFAILAILTLASGVAAMTLRNLVHCALALTLTFVGLAALYLQLDAQFIGFAQILVYVGAVAILIVFAILLTRGGGEPEKRAFTSTWLVGIGVALLVFGCFAAMIISSSALKAAPVPKPDVTDDAVVKTIGSKLMSTYILPLEVIGLLLTAALIGGVIIAMREETK